MVAVAARSGWALGAGVVLALACGGKARSDAGFGEPAAGGEAAEGAKGGRGNGSGGTTASARGGSATSGVPVATGGSSGGTPSGETGGTSSNDTGGAAPEALGGEGGTGGEPTAAICGNGIVEYPEECDDGNASNVDSCSNECRVAGCGDGVRALGEDCDDGNGRNNDDCLNTCKIPSCGDGILHNLGSGREFCDDGEDNGPFPARCSEACTWIECGNGEVDPGEECDDGELNSTVASCLPSCVWNVCGDGYAYLEETPGADSPASLHPCDDANSDFSDACTDTCEWAACGDGNLYVRGYGELYGSGEDGNPSGDNPAALEECDDGNELSGDGCNAECVVELNF